ncbi:MAG: AraC family transcriptional regulator [Candidatus Omnitrophica bacterium]|nr:AraC family transcriptional regulator [Candidatus Omnitrophota bacterium]
MKKGEGFERSGYAENVNQVSDKLGYENAESFIRQFKKFTRFTPTEYRKKILKVRLSAKKKKATKKTGRKKGK